MSYTTNREKLIEIIKEKLQELSTEALDLTPNSNISKFIDIISITDDNLLYYISLLFNEVNLETAILPDTIIHFCKLTGIPFNEPLPTTGTVKLYIEIPDTSKNKKFTIDKDNFFIAENMTYYLDGTYDIVFNSAIQKVFAKKTIDDKEFPVDVEVVYVNGKHTIVVDINVKQYMIETIQKKLPKKTYNIEVNKNTNKGFLYKIQCKYDNMLLEEKYSVYLLDKTKPSFTIVETENTYNIIFATQIQGIPLEKDKEVEIKLYYTQGTRGNVQSNTLTPSFNVVDTYTGIPANTYAMHPDFTNGRNPDSLLDLKRNLHLYFISKTHIISRFPDLDNIAVFSNNISKHAKPTLSVSIAPELTVFHELEFRNEILETSSCLLENYIFNDINKQGAKFLLSKDNKLNFFESSVFQDTNHIQDKDNTCVLPYHMVKNDVLKRIEYVYRINHKNIPLIYVKYSKAYSKDNISMVIAKAFEIQYADLEANVYKVKCPLTIETEDIEWLKQHLNYQVNIVDSDDQRVATFDASNYPVIYSEQEGQAAIEFDIPMHLIELDKSYKLTFAAIIDGELTFFSETSYDSFYKKLPIFSRYKERGVYYDILTPKISTDFDNQNSIIAKAIIYEDKKRISSIYVYLNDTNDTFTEQVISATTTIRNLVNDNTVTYRGKIISQTNKSILIKFENVPEYDYIAELEHFIQFPNDKHVKITYEKLEFHSDVVTHRLYDIFHVPVLSLNSFKTLQSNSAIDYPVNITNELYNQFVDRLVFGSTLNFKFLRTWGTIENIKYNRQVKYSDDKINNLPLPIRLNIELITDIEFTDSDANMVKLDLLNSLQEEFMKGRITKHQIQSVLDKYDSIKSSKIIEPAYDIIYDFDDKEFLQEVYYYVPELPVLKLENIHITYSSTGEI